MSSFFHTIKVGILTIAIAFGLVAPAQPAIAPQSQTLNTGAVATQPIAGSTYALSGNGVSGSAASITLQSFTITQTGQKIQDSDLPDTFYITLDPGNRTKQEIVSCTTVVQNANSTATLSGCSRGLSPITPYTASTTLQVAHGGGASVIFSDPPQHFNLYAAKGNDETITGSWTVPTPTVGGNPTNKTYVDNLAFSGAGVIDATSVSRGVVEMATGAEAAASTVSGGSGRLTLGANLATSTYNSATAANVIPVTKGTGKIDDYFISTTTLFANATFTGVSTFATSSINIGSFPAYNIGKNFKAFTSTGTTSFAIPSGVTKIHVRLVGGGGSGGTGADDTADGSGAGGGAGGYSEGFVDVSATTSVQVHVGLNNEWSTFGTNGFYMYGNGGTDGGATSPGGGGAASGGDINITGQAGGGGKGAVNGTSGTIVTGPSGAGGSSMLGLGGASAAGTQDTGGNNGTGYGWGGSGGVGASGGGGGSGAVFISW